MFYEEKDQYERSLQFIYSLIKSGIKLGLDNPRKLLSLAGNPHEKFKSIHIAGTNGKGSTARMLHSMLMASGKRTGLYTSPHMLRFTERIMVDNEEITPAEVVRMTSLLRESISSVPDFTPTYFEFITALAFKYFEDRSVEWAVVETGMGGRFDATNLIVPEVSVITTVDMDHMQYLGNSLEKIAFEKAGIIKPSVPVVVGKMDRKALQVILSEAKDKGSEVRLFGRDFTVDIKKVSADGITFRFQSSLLGVPLDEINIPLLGKHQAVNAALAAEAFLVSAGADRMNQLALREGLSSVQNPGRAEVVMYEGKKLILDGAHNPQALNALFDTIRVFGEGMSPLTIFGVMKDKDIVNLLRPVVGHSKTVILTKPSYERAESPEVLYRMANQFLHAERVSIIMSNSVPEAIDTALQIAHINDIILITGSFYVVGEAKEYIGEPALLKELREGC